MYVPRDSLCFSLAVETPGATKLDISKTFARVGGVLFSLTEGMLVACRPRVGVDGFLGVLLLLPLPLFWGRELEPGLGEERGVKGRCVEPAMSGWVKDCFGEKG